MAREPGIRPRRRPSQERSRFTVDAILDGAAQVFEARGYAEGTTNRIAERAGVSIGSLYEYFPSKDAIAVALADRELEREGERILAALAEGGDEGADAGLELLLRRLVEAVLELHTRRAALFRILADESAHPPEAHACLLRFEASLAHALEAELRRRRAAAHDPDTAAHLLVQTAESLAHRYALRGIHDLPRERFVEETTRLLARYVAPGG